MTQTCSTQQVFRNFTESADRRSLGGLMAVLTEDFYNVMKAPALQLIWPQMASNLSIDWRFLYSQGWRTTIEDFIGQFFMRSNSRFLWDTTSLTSRYPLRGRERVANERIEEKNFDDKGEKDVRHLPL